MYVTKTPPPTGATMAPFATPHLHPTPLFVKPNPKLKPQLHSLSFLAPSVAKHQHKFSPIHFSYSSSNSFDDSSKSPSDAEPFSQPDDEDNKSTVFVDEWGEKSGPEPEPVTKFSGPDPPGEETDGEWGGVGVKDDGFDNGTPGIDVGESERLKDLKRAFVDTVYGTDFGFRASTEVRAEALELIAQLEAANPTPAPTESPELLDGNWVLLYTAFSELLPLLATGNIPFLKVEKITQSINCSSLTIENSTTISNPVASLSFSASAAFEVRSPSRIQVEFKEGVLKPPEIKSRVDLPENLDIFGQKVNLSPIQQSLGPLQNAVDGLSRAISGQPPLKVPIPGQRRTSWLLITYLDKDLRVSRGDGGLFVLVKEGNPLLDQ